MVEYLTQEREVAGSSLTSVTALCYWARQSMLSTGSTQEDTLRHNGKLFDWHVKNQKQKIKAVLVCSAPFDAIPQISALLLPSFLMAIMLV